MQKIRTYFQTEKTKLSPNESDFLYILNKLDKKEEKTKLKRSPIFMWGLTSATAFTLVFMLLISNENKNNSFAIANKKQEILQTIDSVQSFNLNLDGDF